MVMQYAKRRVEGEDKSPFTLSFRFSNDLVKKINLRWKEEGFANRTALVEAACNLYFDTQECPRCKNRNHKNSLYCSICGNTLHPVYELERKLKFRYDTFLSDQQNLLSLEVEVERERDKYNQKITSSNLTPELKSSLEDILQSADKYYHLAHTLEKLDEEGEEADYCEFVGSKLNPLKLSVESYAWNLIQVRTFFNSLNDVGETPYLLTIEKANDILSVIDYLEHFQTHYKTKLEKDLNLYAMVNKLIDKLTVN